MEVKTQLWATRRDFHVEHHVQRPRGGTLLVMICVCMLSRSVMSNSLQPQTLIAHQALLSMKFFREQYWSGLPIPPPGDLPDPGIKPASSALAGRFFTTELPGRFLQTYNYNQIHECFREWKGGNFKVKPQLRSLKKKGNNYRNIFEECFRKKQKLLLLLTWLKLLIGYPSRDSGFKIQFDHMGMVDGNMDIATT